MPHLVAVLALHDVVPFDLATPCEIFSRVRLADGSAPYRLRVCGVAPRIRAQAYDLCVHHGLDGLRDADTVMVPGINTPLAPVPPAAIAALQAAAARGARLASLCTGAFVLAAAGLLDGLAATTHWQASAVMAARYPAVRVDPAALYIDSGRILTAAGAAAGMDLCLHMVRRDWGAAVAAAAARDAVMPLERAGGQSQFILHEPPASSAGLAPLLAWMTANLHRPLTVEIIAARAAMSPRNLARRFREQTGTTPLQWVLTARIRRAQHLLETTTRSIEQIATDAGFDSAVTFRNRFARVTGTSPSAWRHSFGGGGPLPRAGRSATAALSA